MKPRLALAALSFWFLVACQVAFGDFTIDTSHLSISCESGSTRCDGNQIQSCVSGNEWRVLGTCAAPDSCNLLTRSCSPCQPGTYQCSGAQPQACDSDQHWNASPRDPCASATLCHVPEDGSPATCSAPVCDFGDFQCAGNRLQRCPLSREAWQDVEVCASAEQCNVDRAKAQVAAGQPATCVVSPCTADCPPTECTPGEFRCTVSALERCRSDGARWEPVEQCVNNVFCNPGASRCEAPRCLEAGVKRCQGNLQQTCRADFTGWDLLTQCPAAGSCDPELGCVTSKCAAGAYRCNDVYLEVCSNGNWTHQATCETRALCDSRQHVCNPALCAPGERNCLLNVLRRCNAARDGWQELETCGSGTTCSPDTNRCEAR